MRGILLTSNCVFSPLEKFAFHKTEDKTLREDQKGERVQRTVKVVLPICQHQRHRGGLLSGCNGVRPWWGGSGEMKMFVFLL